jgi:hypothetical protein
LRDVRAFDITFGLQVGAVLRRQRFKAQSVRIDVSPASKATAPWPDDYHSARSSDHVPRMIHPEGAAHIDDVDSPRIGEAVQQRARRVPIDAAQNEIAFLEYGGWNFVSKMTAESRYDRPQSEAARVSFGHVNLPRSANVVDSRTENPTHV